MSQKLGVLQRRDGMRNPMPKLTFGGIIRRIVEYSAIRQIIANKNTNIDFKLFEPRIRIPYWFGCQQFDSEIFIN
jgi:hypothetical protein